MDKGLKVKGGDELGKTIIFARNHRHAQKIVDTFKILQYNVTMNLGDIIIFAKLPTTIRG